MVKLNISELLRTPGMIHRYDVHEMLPSTAELDYASPVVGVLHFNRTSNLLIIRGELEAAVREECVRCLDEVISPIHAEIEEEFAVENYRVVSNVNEEEGNQSVHAFFLDHDMILDEFIRQQMLLAKSDYPLCAEDCKGLCPQCGCDRNEGSCDCVVSRHDTESPLARLAEIYGNGTTDGLSLP